MPEDFEVREAKDGRVLVILHPACSIGRAAILALLGELGIDETAVTFIEPENSAECRELDDVPVIVPIDLTSCDAPELDEAGRACSNAGGRVIILLGETFPYKGVHPIAEKYGTQCGWSAKQLGDCLQGPALPDPRSGDGKPLARPGPKQVKC